MEALLAGLTTKQFRRWQAYFLLEPSGDDRIELLLARLCSLIQGAHYKHQKKPEDFLYRWEPGRRRRGPQKPRYTVKGIHDFFEGLTKAMGGTIVQPCQP